MRQAIEVVLGTGIAIIALLALGASVWGKGPNMSPYVLLGGALVLLLLGASALCIAAERQRLADEERAEILLRERNPSAERLPRDFRREWH